MAEIAGREESEGSDSEEHSDDDAEEEEEEEGEQAAEEGQQQEGPSSTTTAEQDKRIEPTLAPSAVAEEEPSLASLSIEAPPTSDSNNDDEDASDAESDASEASSAFSTALTDMGTHRRHRPSTKRTTPDVSSIVQNKLAKSKTSTERKHHGKKAVTANILGRQKGSKKKQDKTREIRDASGGGW